MNKCCIAAITIMGIAALAPNVFADTVTGAAVDRNGKMNIEIISDSNKEELYTVYVMEKDAALDNSAGTAEISGLIRLEQAALIPKEDMRYSSVALEADMSALPAGSIYKLVLGGGELDGDIVMTVYPTQDTAEEATAAITAADAASVGGVLEQYQNSAWIVDLNAAEYISYRGEVCERLAGIIKERAAAAEDMGACFKAACALTALSHCDTGDFYNTLFRNEYYLGIAPTAAVRAEKHSIADAFVNLRSDTKNNPVVTAADLQNILRKSEALGLLNESSRDNLLGVLTEYNDVFGLDFNGDYKKVDSYSAAKILIPTGEGYKSIEQVKTAFNSAVASLLTSKSSTSQSGGSGNTGGSYIGGGSYVTVEMVENVNDGAAFIDIGEAAWAELYISYLQSRGIMVGDGSGYVRPNDAVTREEFLRILLEALKPEQTEESAEQAAFDDVEENAWYTRYVLDAAALGIVKGIDGSRFGIGMRITREDAAAMIYRAVEAKSRALSYNNEEREFSDIADISPYAVNPVKTLQRAGILSGYESGEFLPKNPVTRAETAKMVYSMLQNLNEL